jgi:microcystin-dependent protein
MVDYTDPRWNESDSQNTSPSPNGLPPGSAPSAIYAVTRANMGAAVRSFDRSNAMGLLTNTANAYSLTYDVPPAAYEKGEFFSFFINATNTGAATININGLGSRDLIQNDGTPLKAGDLVSGSPQTATYDGSKFRLLAPTANPTLGTVNVTTALTVNALPVFTTANDGTGSGLDSDKLDGQEGVWYQARANHTGTQDVATIVGLQALLDAIVPAGTVIHVAGSTVPTGYLAAAGGLGSRTTHARLFAAIGTTYGVGDGTTTFGLPDLRGEFIRGLDSGRNVDTGRTLGSAQTSQNLAHNHTITDPGHNHSISDPGHFHYVGASYIGSGNSSNGGYINNSPNTGAYSSTSTTGISNLAATTGITIANNGGTEARPRNIALLACIKV